jgi:hypothetical protein
MMVVVVVVVRRKILAAAEDQIMAIQPIFTLLISYSGMRCGKEIHNCPALCSLNCLATAEPSFNVP